MKHFLTVCLMLVAVFFAAMFSTSLTAANAAQITVTSIKTINSVSKTRNKITPANDSHRAFVAAELTRSVGTGGGEYDFVVWTESAIDEAARRVLIDAISDEIAKISRSGVLFVSGDPHTWSESRGSKKTLSFNHDMFSLSDRSIIQRFAYGSYVAGAAQTSETTATTEITATTQTTTTSTTATTTTIEPRPTISISQVTLPTQLEPPATVATTSTTAAATTTTAPRPTISISQVTLPTQLEPPATQTTTSTTAAATTASATSTTAVLSTVPITAPTQATQPPETPDRGEDPPGTTVQQTRPSTTAPAANRFPASGGE